MPEELSADTDRLARLEREAHLLAALNHPNIATIYSLEEAEGARLAREEASAPPKINVILNWFEESPFCQR